MVGRVAVTALGGAGMAGNGKRSGLQCPAGTAPIQVARPPPFHDSSPEENGLKAAAEGVSQQGGAEGGI